MIIFTHWMFANHFIHEFDAWRVGDFQLNRMGFRVGNILPDVSAMSKTNHYIEDTKPLIAKYESKVKDVTLSAWERSLALGVLCHFYADFFCKYHNNIHFQKKPILNHCVYEMRLHVILLGLKIKDVFSKKKQFSIEGQLIEANGKVYFEGNHFYQSILNVYLNEQDCLVKDVLYAMLASKHLLMQYLYRTSATNQKAGYPTSEYPAF